MSTAISVCLDDYLNPKYGSNEFDYLDNTEDFVDTTSVKYKAKQLEPVITKVFLAQQAKKAEETQKQKNNEVVKKLVVEKKETFLDRHPGFLNTFCSIAFIACIALIAIAALLLIII